MLDFLNNHAAAFYWTKGVLALMGTLLLLWHMKEARRDSSFGRWLRYLCLLFFAVLVGSASFEQIADGVDVNYRNVGGLVGAVLIIITMIVSIRETREPLGIDPDEIIRRMRDN